jgi:hypothetical protein
MTTSNWIEVVLFAAIVCFVAFSAWMFIQVITKEVDARARAVWAVAIVVAPYAAAPAYYFFRYLRRSSADRPMVPPTIPSRGASESVRSSSAR